MLLGLRSAKPAAADAANGPATSSDAIATDAWLLLRLAFPVSSDDPLRSEAHLRQFLDL